MVKTAITLSTKTKNITPSSYQQAIIDWAKDPTKKHGICNAVAGSGKSTTLKLVALNLMNEGYQPDDILIVVFGKQNQLDLINKFGSHWKNSVHTMHSIGYQIITDTLGKIKQIDDGKYLKIARKLGYIGTKANPGLLLKDKVITCEKDFMKLLSLAQLNRICIDANNLEALITRYGVDTILDIEQCADALDILDVKGAKMTEQKRVLNYDDLICHALSRIEPTVQRFARTRFVLLDECQDFNVTQRELALSLIGEKGRALFVGDPRQAIYGFAGADAISYQQLKERTEATEFPLSVCYRCPKSHIELVNETFPDIPIKAALDASYGFIKQIEESEIVHQQRDLVLSRKTTPLVGYCLKLISQGISARVKGRDIGNQLAREVDNIWNYQLGVSRDEPEFLDFLVHISHYQQLKERQWQELDNKDKLEQALQDKLDAIRVVYNSLTDTYCVNGLKDKIRSLFSSGNDYITLCTVHKAKGFESDRVFILKPDDMPLTYRKQQPWEYEQELNLLYVALTRSKSELFVIGKAGWLREGRLV